MEIRLIVLGIIHRDGKVLIGKRKDKDEFVEHLTWVFPGGELQGTDLKNSLKNIIKEETSLDVEVKELIYARKSPESKVDMVLFYFDCIPMGGMERAGGDLIKLKWVPATSVCEYFTTSVTDRIIVFLRDVEERKL